MLLNVLLVALGGAAGSALRYLLDHAAKAAFGQAFPYGTLLVNVLGCFAIGILAATWAGSSTQTLRLLIITGFLGGFTTFSAFGLETHRLLTTGHTTLALLNIAVNVIVGLSAVGAGMRVARAFA
jgi:fluoride exporter